MLTFLPDPQPDPHQRSIDQVGAGWNWEFLQWWIALQSAFSRRSSAMRPKVVCRNADGKSIPDQQRRTLNRRETQCGCLLPRIEVSTWLPTDPHQDIVWSQLSLLYGKRFGLLQKFASASSNERFELHSLRAHDEAV